MRIQVISDIHGSAADLQTALASFAPQKPDVLLLCGDFLNHGPRNPLPVGYDTKAVAAMLNAHKQRIVCVRGNCDSEVDQMLLEFPCMNAYTTLFFPILPRATAVCDSDARGFVPNGRIFAHHGHLYDRAQLSSLLPRGTLVVSGHTHVTVLEVDGGLLYLNPGSISLPKGSDGKTCALIEADARGIRRIALCGIDGTELRAMAF